MGKERGDSSHALRVMQSFGTPRPTSNPYIHMLDDALAHTPGLVHLRFDRKRALFGRYDVIQFHWPETLFGSSKGVKGMVRKGFALALAARLALGRVAVVRTAHNVELPQDASPFERRYLEWIERRTDHRIVLNALTETDDPPAVTVIPHGHYRDWFAQAPAASPTPHTLGFVGLIRRYKGVEGLIDAFRQTAAAHPELRLCIAGNPTSAGLRAEIEEDAAADSRIDLRFGYLSEDDFAVAVREASGIVLPYRFMHNSGTVLAALSLDRPVLVPRNAVNEALSEEVGKGWITLFDGDLTAADLTAFAERIASPPATLPDLSARGWADAGVAHLAAFRQAVAHRRDRHRGNRRAA